MLGSSKMINLDQVRDCLDRGWIVLAPNHRLCPQVNLLEGPIKDCRDLLSWVYDGGLERFIGSSYSESCNLDLEHVFAFGTSSGGSLALSLVSHDPWNRRLRGDGGDVNNVQGYGVPRLVAGIFNMYGPCDFANECWTQKIAQMKLPSHLISDFMNKVYEEDPVPIEGGVSLEGQANGPPDFSDPRQAFALSQVANGSVMDAVYPSRKWEEVDPLLNINSGFPPTYIVHGGADTKVPKQLSQKLYQELQDFGVQCGMSEAPGEEHTFAAKMEVGSSTWDIQRRGFDFLQRLI